MEKLKSIKSSTTKLLRLTLHFVWLLGFVAMLAGQSTAFAAKATVKPAATGSIINSFTASASSINIGQSVTLAWNVGNGGGAPWLSADVGSIPGDTNGQLVGTRVVTPTATTTYTITVWTPTGNQAASTTVTVIKPTPPKISSFTASPATSTAGAPVTLAWAATDATSLSISPAPGAVTGTSVTVNPTATTTYTLSATNTGGTVTKTAKVTIAVLPTISSFSATPATIVAGNATKLAWSVANATSLSISPAPGTVTGSSVSVSPTANTTYTLTATSAAGSVTQSVNVAVTPAAPSAPKVTSFSASPATIQVGSSTTLNWAVTGADSVSISPEVGATTATSATVSPAKTTTYTLTAVNSIGTTTKTAKVTVTTPPPPAISSFTSSPNFINPGDTATLSWAITGADSVSVSPGVGPVTGNSTAVKPTTTTIYTVSATNVYGTSTQSVLVAVASGGTAVSHPRVWLTPPVVAGLSQRASAADPSWIRLRNQCDTLATYKVLFPDGQTYVDNTINGEYEFSGYIEPAIALGLCYQVARTVDSTRAAAYGAKEKELMLALSDPNHHGAPTVDSGYGIRHYVPAMALGYDWIYDLLSPADRAQIYTEINRWVASFEKVGFNRDFPQGNYFAGYYFALATGAVATEGDNPQSAALYDDWLNRVHYGMVQPYYQQWLAGGGAPDGWNYGPLETLNMTRALLAVYTAKGVEFIHDPVKPMTYPDGHAKWMTQFSWPNQKTINDRGLLYTNQPNRPSSDVDADWATEFNGLLHALGGDNAALMQQYTSDVRAFSTNGTNWTEFLYWNPSLPKASYRTDLSYRTGGDGQAAFRSDWTANAVWGAFQSGPYTGYDSAGEEFFDQGSLVIQRGTVQFLVNADGALTTPTPGQQDASDSAWTELYNDVWSVTHDGLNQPRNNFNTYHSKSGNGGFGQDSSGTTEAKTSLSRFEDAGSYVLMRGLKLEDMYSNAVSKWTRDVAYLRPQLFVVYDRTTVGAKSTDDWMAWHVVSTPAAPVAGAAGVSQIDVVDNRAVSGGNLFRGRISTVLPTGASVSTVNITDATGAPQNRVYRLEVRRPTAAPGSATWLTVFDASANAGAAATAAPLTQANGNVLAGDVEGTVISSAAGNNAVLFSKSGNPIVGNVSISLPQAGTYTLFTDLSANGTYSVTATVANGSVVVSVAPGGAYKATAQGTLAIQVNADGTVAAASTTTASAAIRR